MTEWNVLMVFMAAVAIAAYVVMSLIHFKVIRDRDIAFLPGLTLADVTKVVCLTMVVAFGIIRIFVDI